MTTLLPKFYLVGGAVRDSLMFGGFNDLDYVVVGATPEWMEAHGFKQVGADFPVFLDPEGQEFALARTERKSGKGYHGFVTNYDTSVTLEEDLQRRDLTINAMARDGDTNEIIDPYGGQRDIASKTLRHVSEAFKDDPVRVLRIGRFLARFGSEWSVAPETMELCRQMVRDGELDHLTKERIWAEFYKALDTGNGGAFIRFLNDIHALAKVLPILTFHDDIELIARLATTYSTHTAKQAFANMMTVIDSSLIEDMCTEWKVPSDFIKAALVFRKLNLVTVESEPEFLVSILNSVDAYRNTILFKEMMLKLSVPVRHILARAFELTENISFNDIPEEIRVKLKGPEISKMIRDLKVKKLRGI